MVDDMYEHLRYDGTEFCSFAEAAPDLFDRTLTVNGVSKAYAMTGWRIGYAGGPAMLIKAMVTMQGQSTTNACSIAQAAAVEALNGSQQCVADMCAIYQKRRDLLVAGINAKSNGLRVAAPAGAFYLYVDCTGWLGKTTAKGFKLSTEADVVDYLLQEHLVAAVPGAAFGLSPYFRIYFAIADDVVGQVIERLEKAGAELL
jgi:aspartate aminotransferase